MPRPSMDGGISARNAAPASSIITRPFLPGMVDVQTATFDNPEDHAPQVHVQFAEHLAWMDGIDQLPKFPRYPGQEGESAEAELVP